MERKVRRALDANHSSGATSGATSAGGGKGFGVFNFGGPYPPKTMNQKIRNRWKTLQKALFVLPNTPARTPKIKNKNIYNYILGLYGTIQRASKSVVGANNFVGGSPKLFRWSGPSSGQLRNGPAEIRRNYLEARRHS
jgi:hypothetical protein